jgi:flagellar protein FliS
MQDLSARYRESSIETATKAKLVQMLFARALQHARAGAVAAREKRIEARFNENQRIAEILSVLRGHLDRERGGDIARQLDSIYAHLQIVVMQIDVRGDAGLYDHVIRVLGDLEQAWAALAQTPQGGGAGAQPALPAASATPAAAAPPLPQAAPRPSDRKPGPPGQADAQRKPFSLRI